LKNTLLIFASRKKTSLGGQFRWGGSPLKRYEKYEYFWKKLVCSLFISGAQRLAQPGQKSGVERKSKSQPD